MDKHTEYAIATRAYWLLAMANTHERQGWRRDAMTFRERAWELLMLADTMGNQTLALTIAGALEGDENCIASLENAALEAATLGG